MATRHNLDSEDDGTSTQPVTSCCSEQEQNDDEQLEESIQIHAFCDKVDITWTDGSGQAQSIDDVYFKVDIDTLVSKAIFRLTCRIWVKGKDKNRTSVYLFIHPENIQTIKWEGLDGVSLLHFSMNQGHSRLVVPNDRVLECKHSTLPRLHSMKTLAQMDTFTVHLKDFGGPGLTRHHSRQIASTFSSPETKHPETDDGRVDLQSLYGGIGGHVFDTSTNVAGANHKSDQALPKDTSPPPPIDYEPSREHKPLRKRKRERERGRESSDADYDRPPVHQGPSDSESYNRSSDLKGLIERFFDMENRLINEMKHMVESSENRLRDDVKIMIESSETRLRNHVKGVVEATESRLKDEMNDMLDSRADEIDRKIDGSVDDLKTECIGTIESEFRYLRYGIEEVTKGIEEAEEKTKGVLDLLNEAGDGIERRVAKYLNGIRLQVTVEDE